MLCSKRICDYVLIAAGMLQNPDLIRPAHGEGLGQCSVHLNWGMSNSVGRVLRDWNREVSSHHRPRQNQNSWDSDFWDLWDDGGWEREVLGRRHATLGLKTKVYEQESHNHPTNPVSVALSIFDEEIRDLG